ncbi:MAG: hypothetical protein ACETVR_03915 [Candidatus Bathyarchaeia archaeon]
MKPKVDLTEIIGKIPSELRSDLSIGLMDLLLVSKEGEKVPSPLIKELLNLWRKDELSTVQGLKLLLEAVLSVDPEKAGELFASKGLTELAKDLGVEGS